MAGFEMENSESEPNPARTMIWADTEAKVEIPIAFEVTVEADSLILESDVGRGLVIRAIEGSLLDLVVSVKDSFSQSKEWIEKAKLTSDHRDAFPWLPWPDRFVIAELSVRPKFLAASFDLNTSLLSQRADNMNEIIGEIKVVSDINLHPQGSGTLGVPLFEIPIATLTIQSVEFEEGSTKGKVKASLLTRSACCGAIAAILGAALTTFGGPTETIMEKRLLPPILRYDEAKHIVDDSSCRVIPGFSFSPELLYQQFGEWFDYEDLNVSAKVRKLRGCNLQLLLRMANGSDLDPDGTVGKDTKKELDAFAKRNKVPANIHDRLFQAALLHAVWPYQRVFGWVYVYPGA